MYEIDFSRPHKVGETVKEKDKSQISKEASSSFQEEKQSITKTIFGSKLVWFGAILSIALFSYGKYEIEEKYLAQPQQRVFSDVEFMNYGELAKNQLINFESETAKSIHTIEYQKYALENLNTIITLIDNDLNAIQNVLPMEIHKSTIKFSNFERGTKENQSLLISIEGKSTIQKHPMITNFALHFEGLKVVKIQGFFQTDDDFIIQDSLKKSTFANWHKKTSIIDSQKIVIYEANLKEPVIPQKELPTEVIKEEVKNILPQQDAIGNETEDEDEKLTAEDLEKHENTEEETDEESEKIKSP